MKSWTVLLCVAAMSSVLGCAGLRTPPTFALAWVDPSLSIQTAESLDAVTFINQRVVPTVTGQHGPAIGHDGNLTWLAVWSTTSGFNFNTGAGGIPTNGAAGGINWSGTIERGIVPGSPAGSPSVAFGGGRWVIAYRNASNRILVIRSSPNSVTAWEPPIAVDPPSSRTPALSLSDPAIAYGNGVFVIAFKGDDPFSSGAVAAVIKSRDGGVNWSGRSDIARIEDFAPGLTFGGGNFIAILPRTPAPLSAHRFFVHVSRDGQTWSDSVGGSGNLDPANGGTRLGVAYGQGQLVVVHGCNQSISSWIGTPINAAGPPFFNFLPGPPLCRSSGLAAVSGRSPSIAFGSTP